MCWSTVLRLHVLVYACIGMHVKPSFRLRNTTGLADRYGSINPQEGPQLQSVGMHGLREVPVELCEPVTRQACHRPAGTSCDELKDLGGWKSRVMVDRYAKFATENLTIAAARIERERGDNVAQFPTISPRSKKQRASG